MTSLRCPRCRTSLRSERAGSARVDRCAACRGVAVNLAVLRQFAPKARVQELWRSLQTGRPGAPCASCGNAGIAADVRCGGRLVEIDSCRPCQMLWFDANELAAFSPTSQAAPRVPAVRPEPAGTLERLGTQRHGAPGEVEGMLQGEVAVACGEVLGVLFETLVSD